MKAAANKQTDKIDHEALDEDAATFKVLKPVDFAAALLKSQTNFKVW